MLKRLAGMMLAGAMALGLASGAEAAWPEKPIKVIVPFNAGGTSDQMARAYQLAIEENHLLPQPITIVNVGGHFSIGARQVMEAEPDGYTFLIIHIALMGGEATGAMNFGYRDFAPVATTGEFCVMPVVRKDSGIDSLQQLLQKAEAEPKSLLFGCNIGAINHMAGIMLQNAQPGAAFRFVQIGGGAENFTALTGKQTNASVLAGAEVLKFTRMPDGSDNPESQVKALAYLGDQRISQLADVPTAKELGYDVQFCVQNWWFAPKDTPPEVVAAFADAMEKASKTDRIKKFLADQAFGDVFLKGDAMQASLDKTWKDIQPVALQAKGG
jgi:tripartite-type tricarboxylate transporter receptor subunit TctC